MKQKLTIPNERDLEISEWALEVLRLQRESKKNSKVTHGIAIPIKN